MIIYSHANIHTSKPQANGGRCKQKSSVTMTEKGGLLVYLKCSSQFIGGMTAGAVKG